MCFVCRASSTPSGSSTPHAMKFNAPCATCRGLRPAAVAVPVAKSTLDTAAASWPAEKSVKSAPTAHAMAADPFGVREYCPLSVARTTVAVTVLPTMAQLDDRTPVLSCAFAVAKRRPQPHDTRPWTVEDGDRVGHEQGGAM